MRALRQLVCDRTRVVLSNYQKHPMLWPSMDLHAAASGRRAPVMAGNRHGCKEKKRTPYRKVISRKEDVKKWSKSTVQSRERGLRDEGEPQSKASRFFRVTGGSLFTKRL